MLTNLSNLVRNTGSVLMVVAVFSLVLAIIFRESRSERRAIFMQSMISALLLWYISWLIG